MNLHVAAPIRQRLNAFAGFCEHGVTGPCAACLNPVCPSCGSLHGTTCLRVPRASLRGDCRECGATPPEGPCEMVDGTYGPPRMSAEERREFREMSAGFDSGKCGIEDRLAERMGLEI